MTRYTGKVENDNNEDDYDYHDGCESNDYENDDGVDCGRHGDKGGGGENEDDDDDPLMSNYTLILGPPCFMLHTVIRKNWRALGDIY